MFHFDRGLRLTVADLAIDCPRRQRRAFISHAHLDHMARHEYALCTPETARLYHLRLGKRPVLELPYRQPIEWGGLRLTTYPAGHCLGSAMLRAEDGRQSLLYTGDFQLAESATAARAELPRADVLVMESTYGDPRHQFADRASTVAQLLALVHEAVAARKTPVVHAYTLGKAQEVTRLLTAAGIAVVQHPDISAISAVYTACGVELGPYQMLGSQVAPGTAVIVPPRMHHAGALADRPDQVRIAVTGWALGSATDLAALQRRWGVDVTVPLSDHADFAQLLAAVEMVQPREIYCVHGPASFVDHLRERGFNARRGDSPR